VTAFFLADGTRDPDPWFMLASGGLMLGRCSATDPVARRSRRAGLAYGALIGVVTIIIRPGGR
jgi:Na+-translocating ferredoxin:NAD+ oxidoreductase RnfD subunit